jgi:TDG/mug DNA glycosylase family protein
VRTVVFVPMESVDRKQSDQETASTFNKGGVEEDRPWRPTRSQLKAAYGKTVPDVIAENLEVLFCGINPGLYSGAVSHHFARPGNRFWRTLRAAGFTERVLSPFEERRLLRSGFGITNLVDRATASAGELSREDLRRGARRLEAKVRRYRPRYLAILGLDAYRKGFHRPSAAPGLQPCSLGSTSIWLLPNPSGLNAHYQLPELVEAFRALRDALG